MKSIRGVVPISAQSLSEIAVTSNELFKSFSKLKMEKKKTFAGSSLSK